MKLCVVTDIHQRPEADICLSRAFEPTVEVVRFSLATLCGRPELSGEALHRYLIQADGMGRVVGSLRDRLSDGFIGIGYSAGGTALWRVVASGVPCAALACVSSTRLRDENAIPVPSLVVFGAEDGNRPADNWLARVPSRAVVLSHATHDYYLAPESGAVRHTLTALSDHFKVSLR